MPGMYEKDQPCEITVGPGESEREIIVRMPTSMGSTNLSADEALAIGIAQAWLGRLLPPGLTTEVRLIEPDRATAEVTFILPEPRSYRLNPTWSTSPARSFVTITERITGNGGWLVKHTPPFPGRHEVLQASLPLALEFAAELLDAYAATRTPPATTSEESP